MGRHKRIYIGLFNKESDVAIRYFGEFANINIIKEDK